MDVGGRPRRGARQRRVRRTTAGGLILLLPLLLIVAAAEDDGGGARARAGVWTYAPVAQATTTLKPHGTALPLPGSALLVHSVDAGDGTCQLHAHRGALITPRAALAMDACRRSCCTHVGVVR